MLFMLILAVCITMKAQAGFVRICEGC